MPSPARRTVRPKGVKADEHKRQMRCGLSRQIGSNVTGRRALPGIVSAVARPPCPAHAQRCIVDIEHLRKSILAGRLKPHAITYPRTPGAHQQHMPSPRHPPKLIEPASSVQMHAQIAGAHAYILRIQISDVGNDQHTPTRGRHSYGSLRRYCPVRPVRRSARRQSTPAGCRQAPCGLRLPPNGRVIRHITTAV